MGLIITVNGIGCLVFMSWYWIQNFSTYSTLTASFCISECILPIIYFAASPFNTAHHKNKITPLPQQILTQTKTDKLSVET
jgi:hypothetical protein